MKKAKLKLKPLTLVMGKFNNEPLLLMEYANKIDMSINVVMITEKNIYVKVGNLLISETLKHRALAGARDYINANLPID